MAKKKNNPVEQARREAKKKELKKVKKQRDQQRKENIGKNDPKELLKEYYRGLDAEHRQKTVDKQLPVYKSALAKRQKLQDTLSKVLAYLEETKPETLAEYRKWEMEFLATRERRRVFYYRGGNRINFRLGNPPPPPPRPEDIEKLKQEAKERMIKAQKDVELEKRNTTQQEGVAENTAESSDDDDDDFDMSNVPLPAEVLVKSGIPAQAPLGNGSSSLQPPIPPPPFMRPLHPQPPVPHPGQRLPQPSFHQPNFNLQGISQHNMRPPRPPPQQPPRPPPPQHHQPPPPPQQQQQQVQPPLPQPHQQQQLQQQQVREEAVQHIKEVSPPPQDELVQSTMEEKDNEVTSLSDAQKREQASISAQPQVRDRSGDAFKLVPTSLLLRRKNSSASSKRKASSAKRPAKTVRPVGALIPRSVKSKTMPSSTATTAPSSSSPSTTQTQLQQQTAATQLSRESTQQALREKLKPKVKKKESVSMKSTDDAYNRFMDELGGLM
eukprot:m.68702 g.68702  ORF g.68702 m.68702 type:complete len:495 (+) comp11614_c0_seq1:115-1599(+)